MGRAGATPIGSARAGHRHAAPSPCASRARRGTDDRPLGRPLACRAAGAPDVVLMWLCLSQDLRHTSTAHLARPPCVAEPGYLIELCSQRSRTYPHTGHPHGHPQTGSDNRVSESWKVEHVKAPSGSRMENRTPNTSKESCQKPFHPFFLATSNLCFQSLQLREDQGTRESQSASSR